MSNYVTETPKEWKEVELSEVILSANTGLDAIKRAPIVNENTGIKCFRIQDASQSKNYNDWGFSRVDDKNYQKFRLKKGDILIARTGNTIGCNYLVKNDLNSVFNNGLIRLRVNEKTTYDYIYNVITSKAFGNYIQSIAHGTSAQPNMQINALLHFKLMLPPIDKQCAISAILSSLNEKIELNRKMNETLEQMGQALFRHYFIDNPKAETWSKRELGEFFPIKTGKKDANFSTEDGEFPFFTCAQTISRSPNYSFDAHALLLAGNGDFNIKLYRGKFEAYQRTYVLVPKNEEFVGLLYFLMKIKLPEITGGSRGSVIKFITKGMIENYKFSLPRDEEIAKMATIFNQLTINIEENVKQIQTLISLRDILLPRLISGKIKI